MAKAFKRGRSAAINGNLQEDFGQLFARDSVAERALDVDLEFMLLAHSRQHAEIEERARTPVETFSAPHLAPGIAGHVILNGFSKRVRVRKRPVHMLVAEDFAAHLIAFLIEFVCHRPMLLILCYAARPPIRPDREVTATLGGLP